jgi:hypothetical protein
MWKKIGLGLAAALVVLLVVIALQPSHFVVERSTTMQAPADVPYALVSDFHAWEAWSPYAKLDPTMKTTYEGPPRTVGSSYSWEGNSQAGKGRMTLSELQPSQRVDIQLEFTAPMKATNHAAFAFAPEGTATKVTWSMEGDNGFVSKAFCLFVDMDKLVGTDFEKGLASLKTLAEADAARRRTETPTAAAAPTPDEH